MSFIHFTSYKPKPEKIIIHVSSAALDEGSTEVEDIIRQALNDNTWERTKLIAPGFITINIDGSSSVNNELGQILLDLLCDEIIDKIKNGG